MEVIYYRAYEGDGRRHKLALDQSYATYELDDDCFEDLAVACAEDFHSNYDGWESEWPRVITLYATETGPALAFMEVDREYTPSFNASPVGD